VTQSRHGSGTSRRHISLPLAAIAEPERGGYHRYLGWTFARLSIPAERNRAVSILVPLERDADAPDAATLATPPPFALARLGVSGNAPNEFPSAGPRSASSQMSIRKYKTRASNVRECAWLCRKLSRIFVRWTR
jgi:hypothetical protein